ncbi:hypothetical protein AVTE2539_04875 [Acidovorax sp. SUPP2539]|nr:hypothetical protein AVTE2539_04875 [Acidovorax sp. SUPP2539]
MNLHQYAPNPIAWVDPWGWQNEPVRVYEDAPYHGTTDNSVKSRAPTNGQAALNNPVQVKPTSPRRVGVDVVNKEIVVIDRTQVNVDGSEKYHGHVRPYGDLHVDQQNALKKAKKIDKKGNIIDCKPG